MVPLTLFPLLALLCRVQAQVLQGLHFQDGRSERVIWEHDEYPSYEFDPDLKVPTQISFCARFYPEYVSQPGLKGWDGIGLFQVWTHERNNEFGASIEFDTQAFRPNFWIMDAADSVHNFAKGNPYYRENTLRKWNSVCFSVDFGKKDQTCQVSWNGQISKEKSTGPNQWGWNYGMGTPGLNFTLGKYWNGPYFIGKIVEFNAWNRLLTEEEHLQYSNCETYHEAKGNLMSSKTKWRNSNKFIVDYEVSWDEIQCSKKNSYTAAPIAALQKGFLGSVKTCNKLEKNGVLPEILTHQDYHDHYWLVKNHSAFEEEFKKSGNGRCWKGGRLRYFIPYIETDDATAFVHYYTGSKLEFPYWLDWFNGPDPSRAPRNDVNRWVLSSYYGVGGEYNESYVGETMDCSGCLNCITCKIEHNYLNSTYVNLRGLCSVTKFDKVFFPRFADNNLVMYYGGYDSVIEYNLEREMWELYVTFKPTIFAESKSLYGTLALGNQKWTIYNDTDCSSDTETKTLTLSTCTTDQFTCDEGTCIGIDLRCDGNTDCDDQSDEVGCNSLNIGKSYKKNDPPPPYFVFKDREYVLVNISTVFIVLQGKLITLCNISSYYISQGLMKLSLAMRPSFC